MRVADYTGLARRASGIGAAIVGAPRMLVYHAVDEQALLAAIRSQRGCEDLALVARRRPCMRRHLWGLIWSRTARDMNGG